MYADINILADSKCQKYNNYDPNIMTCAGVDGVRIWTYSMIEIIF